MKPKFIIILNLLLGAALLGGGTLHPYTVSAETAEIETDSDDLEGVEYDNADQNGVLLDIDIVPDEYDRKHYDAALNTVYLEDTDDSQQELSLYTDYSPDTDKLTWNADEEKGILTLVFPNTYNAVGEQIPALTNSTYVKTISVTSDSNNTTVTVTYQPECMISVETEDVGFSITFSKSSYSLRIRLPEGVTMEQIIDTDYYYNHKFVLQIPGRHKSLYDQYPIIRKNPVITGVKVTQSGSNTKITVSTSKLQGYKYTRQGDYLFVTIDRPRKIYKNIVVLDAGHGGKDFGATNRGSKEKAINFKIIYSFAREYFDGSSSSVKAYWSRYNDKFISLSERARFAAEVEADLFVSLHMNSASNRSANGMEVYYAKSNNRVTDTGLSSQKLARKMHDRLENNLTIPSRGVKKAEFYVLRHNTVPSILIELGFISGNRDYNKITSPAYQKKAAQNIYEGIADIFKAYPTGR